MLEMIGRFHLVVLHLPIGFIAALGILHFLHAIRTDHTEPATQAAQVTQASLRILAWLTGLGLLIAAILGTMLYYGGNYAGDENIDDHLLAGWVCCATGLITACLYQWKPGIMAVGAMLITGLLTIITGHLGGKYTHGENFLFHSSTPTERIQQERQTHNQSNPTDDHSTQDGATKSSEKHTNNVEAVSPHASITNTASPTLAITFDGDIYPVLLAKCIECHGPDSVKGGLRVDTIAGLLAGGNKDGAAIIAGDADASPLIERSLRPVGTRGRMPKRGSPLTEAEISLLKNWINAGNFNEVDNRVPSTNINTSDGMMDQTMDGMSATSTTTQASKAVAIAFPETQLEQHSKTLSPASSTAMETLTNRGATVVPLSNNAALLEVDLSHVKEADPSIIPALEQLAPHIAWLDAGGTPVADIVPLLSKMLNLQRAILDHSTANDSVCRALAALPALQEVNLVATPVTDAGLAAFHSHQNLTALWLWRSKVSRAGVQKLRKALPQARINFGE